MDHPLNWGRLTQSFRQFDRSKDRSRAAFRPVRNMLVLPLSTDAPLYHIPWVTGGIILSNIVIFFATTFQLMIGNLEVEQIEWLMIQFNQINPVQWFTGSFMHADFGHLIGNMLFLFSFGIIVEGKIGNLRYLGIYLALCAATGAITQIPMCLMGSDEAALGASAAISGIMMIALMWAPDNEISVFYWILLVFFGITEVRVITMALFCIAFDVYAVIFSGFAMSGAMAHTLGTLLGIPIGAYFLRNSLVDCEGWDVVSRNPWLQKYKWLYGEAQRKADRSREDELYDPVGKALEVSGASEQAAKQLGFSAPLPTQRKNRQVTGSSQTRSSKTRKGLYRHQPKVDPVVEREQQCQAHADFNRLSFVLRQSLQTGNDLMLESTFQKMESMKLSLGLSEQTLWSYAEKMAKLKRWTDTIRPYTLIFSKRGSRANEAALRLAQVYLRIAKRPDLAVKVLRSMEISVDDASISQKRDDMLRTAEATAERLSTED
ncbi:MAG: rhomboid family intramembrane serine protease [Planctomycetota bacterium]